MKYYQAVILSAAKNLKSAQQEDVGVFRNPPDMLDLPPLAHLRLEKRVGLLAVGDVALAAVVLNAMAGFYGDRSEERRVGKECRL